MSGTRSGEKRKESFESEVEEYGEDEDYEDYEEKRPKTDSEQPKSVSYLHLDNKILKDLILSKDLRSIEINFVPRKTKKCQFK